MQIFKRLGRLGEDMSDIKSKLGVLGEARAQLGREQGPHPQVVVNGSRHEQRAAGLQRRRHLCECDQPPQVARSLACIAAGVKRSKGGRPPCLDFCVHYRNLTSQANELRLQRGVVDGSAHLAICMCQPAAAAAAGAARGAGSGLGPWWRSAVVPAPAPARVSTPAPAPAPA